MDRPWRSPHLAPSSSFGSAFPFPLPTSATSLLSILRSRLVASLLLGTLTVLFLISYIAGVPLPLLATSVNGPGFPSHGLKRDLWKQLNQLDGRHFVLHPREVAWTRQSSPEEPVPWTQEGLLPPRSSSSSSSPSYSTSAKGLLLHPNPPTHVIDTYPRVPLLAEDQTFPRGRDLIFGMATTVKRAKEMSELWTRWLLPVVEGDEDSRPGCMVLLSRDEDPKEIEELRVVLKGRGLVCGLRTSEHERYEVRVLSMTRELKDYAEEIGCAPPELSDLARVRG